MFNTIGKTTLITGGLSGIGKSIAEKAAQDKNTIVLVQRRSSDTIEKELLKLGAKAVIQIQADLSELKSIYELVAQLKQMNLEIDILVNNAGLLTGGLIEEQDSDQIYKMINVNLSAVIILTQLILRSMLKRKTGRIVNNASVSGKMYMPCASTYAASKAGVVAFTESIRQELYGTGVSTLLLITPGVKTEMYDDIKNQYGKNMDLSFLKSMPASEWADMVWNAVKSDQEILLPKGSERVGVWLATHIPALFEKGIRKYFNRNLK
jgi:uncharacterized protein